MPRHTLRRLLVAAVFVHGAVASDYSGEFISLGMDGDYNAAEQVLKEWSSAQPDNSLLPSMRQLLADWRADAEVVDPYRAIADAIMSEDYAQARAALKSAESHSLATLEQQAVYLAWIERFEAHHGRRSISALQLEFADFQLQRSMHQFELAGRELQAVDQELDGAMAELNATLERLDADLQSLEAENTPQQ